MYRSIRPDSEIEEEIVRLEACKEFAARKLSFLDTLRSIDSQILVLKTRATLGEITERCSNESFSDAILALDWMEYRAYAPSYDWEDTLCVNESREILIKVCAPDSLPEDVSELFVMVVKGPDDYHHVGGNGQVNTFDQIIDQWAHRHLTHTLFLSDSKKRVWKWNEESLEWEEIK